MSGCGFSDEGASECRPGAARTVRFDDLRRDGALRLSGSEPFRTTVPGVHRFHAAGLPPEVPEKDGCINEKGAEIVSLLQMSCFPGGRGISAS